METYISILRGINVSGHRIIKMEKLRQLYLDLGFENVKSYIQSGNVVFQTKEESNEELGLNIEKCIKDNFGFEVPVIVNKLQEFKQILNSNPFLKDKTKNISFLHITFLSEKPKKVDLENILNDKFEQDEFNLLNKAVYLYCPNSYSNSKLTNKFFEKKLKVMATTRNWKTALELLNLAQSS
jgi:uncharacterized protein (DUF1697 family)